MNESHARDEPVVIVVDDDLAVREALVSLLRSVSLHVEAFASSREFLAYRLPDTPACLVLDVRLPGLNGLELQKRLAQEGQRPPIVFITGHGDIPMSVRAMRRGAVDFLPKPFRDTELLRAIDRALERDRNELAARKEIAALRSRYDSLTPREREVMALVARGLLNKQIAAELGTAEITVKVHRQRITRKMQAASLADLVRMAEKLHAAPIIPADMIPR